MKIIKSEKSTVVKSFRKFKMDEFLKERGLWDCLLHAGGYSVEVVREFYANIHSRFFDETSNGFGKIYARGRVYEVTPNIINDFFQLLVLIVNCPKETKRI